MKKFDGEFLIIYRLNRKLNHFSTDKKKPGLVQAYWG